MSAARPVYSTGPGGGRSSRDDRGSGEPVEPTQDLPPERHAVRVRLDRSGRKGKQVTVLGPFLLRRDTARDLLGPDATVDTEACRIDIPVPDGASRSLDYYSLKLTSEMPTNGGWP